MAILGSRGRPALTGHFSKAGRDSRGDLRNTKIPVHVLPIQSGLGREAAAERRTIGMKQRERHEAETVYNVRPG